MEEKYMDGVRTTHTHTSDWAIWIWMQLQQFDLRNSRRQPHHEIVQSALVVVTEPSSNQTNIPAHILFVIFLFWFSLFLGFCEMLCLLWSSFSSSFCHSMSSRCAAKLRVKAAVKNIVATNVVVIFTHVVLSHSHSSLSMLIYRNIERK